MADSQFPSDISSENLENNKLEGSVAKNKKYKVLLGILAVIIVIVIFIIGFLKVTGNWQVVSTLLMRRQNVEPEILMVVNDFMLEMKEKNAEAAFALWSTCDRGQIGLADLEQFLDGSSYSTFEDYKNLYFIDIVTLGRLNPSPGDPQTPIIEAAGHLIYEDDISGTFIAAFVEDDNGEWKLCSFHANLPPEMINNQ
jgi:hypothetical protein